MTYGPAWGLLQRMRNRIQRGNGSVLRFCIFFGVHFLVFSIIENVTSFYKQFGYIYFVFPDWGAITTYINYSYSGFILKCCKLCFFNVKEQWENSVRL